VNGAAPSADYFEEKSPGRRACFVRVGGRRAVGACLSGAAGHRSKKRSPRLGSGLGSGGANDPQFDGQDA